jgi:hypothetical protein
MTYIRFPAKKNGKAPFLAFGWADMEYLSWFFNHALDYLDAEDASARDFLKDQL